MRHKTVLDAEWDNLMWIVVHTKTIPKHFLSEVLDCCSFPIRRRLVDIDRDDAFTLGSFRRGAVRRLAVCGSRV